MTQRTGASFGNFSYAGEDGLREAGFLWQLLASISAIHHSVSQTFRTSFLLQLIRSLQPRIMFRTTGPIKHHNSAGIAEAFTGLSITPPANSARTCSSTWELSPGNEIGCAGLAGSEPSGLSQ